MTEPRDNDSPLVRLPSGDVVVLPPAQQRIVDAAQSYIEASRSPNTRRAYKNGMQLYTQWCAEVEIEPEPITPTKAALFATTLAEIGSAWSTINVALAALDYARKLKGLDPIRSSREVSEVCEGIRRVHGTKQDQAKPITVEMLRTVCEGLQGPAAVRDQALLLLGFAGAFRRSELVSLNIADLVKEENGYVVMLQRSKTDQTGRGFVKGIPYGGRASTCPVRALDAWIASRSVPPRSPLFVPFSPCCPIENRRLSDQSVNRVIKVRLREAGLDPYGFSGHSLRAGFVTAAAKAGKRLDLIMQQTGHKSVETVMRYIRHAELFTENAAEGLGL